MRNAITRACVCVCVCLSVQLVTANDRIRLIVECPSEVVCVPQKVNGCYFFLAKYRKKIMKN